MKAGLEQSDSSNANIHINNHDEDSNTVPDATYDRPWPIDEADARTVGVSNCINATTLVASERDARLQCWSRLLGLCSLGLLVVRIFQGLLLQRDFNYRNVTEVCQVLQDNLLTIQIQLLLTFLYLILSSLWLVWLVAVLMDCAASPVLTGMVVSFRLLQQMVLIFIAVLQLGRLLLSSSSTTFSQSIFDATFATLSSLKNATQVVSDDAYPTVTVTASQAFLYFFFQLEYYSTQLSVFFSGLSFLLLGTTCLSRTMLFPIVLSGLLLVGGMGYMADAILYVAYWEHYHGQLSLILTLPSLIAEISMTAFLCFAIPTRANEV